MKLASFISHVALCLIMTASSLGAVVIVDLEQDLEQQQEETSSSSNLAVASSIMLRGNKAPPPPTPDGLGQGRKTYRTITYLSNLDGLPEQMDMDFLATFTQKTYNDYNRVKDIIADYDISLYKSASPPRTRMPNMEVEGSWDFQCGHTCPDDRESQPFFVVLAKAASGFYDDELETTGGNQTNLTALLAAANLAGTQVAINLCNNLRRSGVRKFRTVRNCRILDASRFSDNWDVDTLEELSSSQQQEEEYDDKKEDTTTVLEQ